MNVVCAFCHRKKKRNLLVRLFEDADTKMYQKLITNYSIKTFSK